LGHVFIWPGFVFCSAGRYPNATASGSYEVTAIMTATSPVLALHGGAGALRGRDYAAELAHMRGLVEAGRDRLMAGASALDVAVETVAALEVSGLYVAGRGASPNTDGGYQLDACLMDGRDQRAGAVAALEGFVSPIAAARAVMEESPHVLLVGAGAGAFARSKGLAEIGDPKAWYTHAGGRGARTAAELATGTVGCVVLDQSGALAAATSTAGVFGKLPGRVGDSPIPGAGAWADADVAVSCTGAGEMFIRAAVAAQVGFRVRLAGETLAQAAGAALAEALTLGGEGGLIAVGRDGAVAMPFTSAGMKRAALLADGSIVCEVF
jgi:L-asparaginase/beta-aspartyl-peptidase (threonine type)